MDAKAFERIERLNYLFGAVATIAAFILTERPVAFGVGAGALLSCINFSIIRALVSKLVSSTAKTQSITAFYFVPKMAGLMAAVALCIYFLPISAIGLGIGFSVFLLSIGVETLRHLTSIAND